MKKYVGVRHYGCQDIYVFMTDLDLEPGDVVVCDTQKGYQTARVICLYTDVNYEVKKWIVCKVDLTKHKVRLHVEKGFKEIKDEIEVKKEQIEALLNEYKALNNF